MRPKKHETTGEEGLFRARSSHMKHELVQLAGKLDWDWLDGEISTATKAGPGLRLASSLGCCCSSASSRYPMRRCVRVGSMTSISSTSSARSFFQHALPHERSDLSHWKKRLGEKLELLLAESLRVAHEAGALRTRDLKRVTVDTPCSPRHHVSDRRQVAACRDPGAQSPRPQARNTTATVPRSSASARARPAHPTSSA
jgi:transposase, IS5 family